jgi:hypothetical protein
MTTSQHPARIGRYEIQRPLGSGAMGDVYLAHDPNIDRQLALKTVRVIGGSDEDIVDRKQRLLREARAAGRLIHPHVVALFDAGEADGLLYLAFEYVPGQDLLKRARTAPELTLREVLRIVRETASALDYAHQQEIVHRDIKPSNILINPRGEAKVADFGIAKLRDQSTELTRTGSVVGSPQYMSPEQIRGEALDGRSDIFSLGVVLYELLSRTRPFAGDTISTLVFEILAKDPPPIESLRPSLPSRLVQLVSWMLAKDRNQRIPTARAVVGELEQLEREIAAGVLDKAMSDHGPENQPTRLMASSGAPIGGAGSGPVPVATPSPFAPPTPPGFGAAGPPTGAPVSGYYPMPPQAPTPPAFSSAAQPIVPPPYPTSSGPGAYQPPAGPPPPPPMGATGPGHGGRYPAVAPQGGQFSPQPPARPKSGGAGKIIALFVILALLGLGVVVGYVLMRGKNALEPPLDPQEQTQTAQNPAIPAPVPTERPPQPSSPPASQVPAYQTPTSPPGYGQTSPPAESTPGPGTTRPADVAPRRPAETLQNPSTPSRPAETSPRRPDPPATQPTQPEVAESRPNDGRSPLARLGEAAGRAAPVGTAPSTVPRTLPEPVEDDNGWGAAAATAKMEIESGLRFQFKVTPPEARVLFWSQGDRRAIVQGSAAEFDPKRDEETRTLELPGDGEYLVILRHGDFPEYVIRVHADRSRGDKPRLLQLALGGGARSASSAIRVSKGVSFAGTPDDAYVLINGKNMGRASDYPGAKKARSEDNLKLDRGKHVLRLEAPGFKPQEFRIEVAGGAPAVEQISYRLEKEQ